MQTARELNTTSPANGIRTVVLASADAGLRQRLRVSLTGLRWQVREARGGAEAMAFVEENTPEAMLVDSWLPDLEAGEFAGQIRRMYPGIEVLRVDGASEGQAVRSPRRNELLHALREAQETPLNDTAAWLAAPVLVPVVSLGARDAARRGEAQAPAVWSLHGSSKLQQETPLEATLPVALERATPTLPLQAVGASASLPELVGRSQAMLELAQLIRLVAPRSTSVLIEGETGTGKEVVARALHRLSLRSSKAFAVLNCAAIPEALLEAELFGHTRGAFTGAVQSRMGRIEAADGGTLFLDEIGEMPLALQAKMLRFLECGELQRVGDNETLRVDVRVIAATHQPLLQRSEEKTFRLDLYHRLAVFPIEVPPLRIRMEDVDLLAEHFLTQMGRDTPRKQLSPAARRKLQAHNWPGNVRELMHVLERGTILCGEWQEIDADEIRFGRVTRA